MLRLTMNVGEYFIVNNDIRVKFERMDGVDKIFMMIEAPKEVGITRSQVYEVEVRERAKSGDPRYVELWGEIRADREKRGQQRAKRNSARLISNPEKWGGTLAANQARKKEKDAEYAKKRKEAASAQ